MAIQSRNNWREFTPVGDALSQFIKVCGLSDTLANKAVREAWRAVVGEEICQHTRVAGIRKNILIIEVDSAPWLTDLASFYKQSILQSIHQKMPNANIKDIQFKAGRF